MSKLVSGHNYDILDNHRDKFKMPDKEFKPRIKNTSKESTLQKSSSYQPPRRRKKQPNNTTRDGQESVVSVNERLRKVNDDELVDEIASDEDDESVVKENIQNQLNTSKSNGNRLNESGHLLNTSNRNQSDANQIASARRAAAQK